MKFADILTYVTHNAEVIIQWLFFTIIALSSLVVGRYIFAKRETESVTSGAPLPGEIQSVLQKILDQTNKLENVSADSFKGGASQEALIQVELLKKDLQAREEELSKLRASDVSSEKTAEFTSRIKELEARLEEYSILEDDIADLSLYKEENVRLKAELEQLKAEGLGAGEGSGLDSDEEEILDPSLDEVTVEAASDIPGSEATEPNAEDNLVADFESAVARERELTQESADLFGEFAQNGENVEEAEPDSEKMMRELAEIVASGQTMEGSALDAEVDTSKVAEEADTLSKSS